MMLKQIKDMGSGQEIAQNFEAVRLSSRVAGVVFLLLIEHAAGASELPGIQPSGSSVSSSVSPGALIPGSPEGTVILASRDTVFRFDPGFLQQASQLPVLGEGEQGPSTPSFNAVLLILSIAFMVRYVCSQRFLDMLSDVCSTLLAIEQGDRCNGTLTLLPGHAPIHQLFEGQLSHPKDQAYFSKLWPGCPGTPPPSVESPSGPCLRDGWSPE